jgi:hypothetical protein
LPVNPLLLLRIHDSSGLIDRYLLSSA